MTNTIELTVKQARGIVLASAKNDVRYYLKGVLFDFENGRLVATDGHILLAANIDSAFSDPAFGEAIVPRDAIENIAKGGRHHDGITVTYDADGVHLARNGTRITVEPIQGTFPQWRRVFPDKTTNEPAQFNPELLQRLSKAYQAMTDTNDPPYVAHNGERSALVFRDGYADRCIGVVMPMRMKGDPIAALATFDAGPAKADAA